MHNHNPRPTAPILPSNDVTKSCVNEPIGQSVRYTVLNEKSPCDDCEMFLTCKYEKLACDGYRLYVQGQNMSNSNVYKTKRIRPGIVNKRIGEPTKAIYRRLYGSNNA